MSQQNPSQQNQQQDRREPKVKSPDDMLTVKVLVGKHLREHKVDGQDQFYQVGEVFSVPRAYYEQHLRERTFDSYHTRDGAIIDRPITMKDPTIELVEDPVEVYNKSLVKAA
jgi:hypothetical protein